MKILKTLAVFFVLLALTVGAVAAEKVYPDYDPFTKDNLKITMPEGLVYTMNQKPGHIDIVINSDRTDWDLVATQADSWGEVVIDFGVEYPEGTDLAAGTRGHNLDLPGDWSYANMKNDYDACYDFLVYQASASPRSGGGQLGIAMYSDSIKTIIPTPYDGNQKAYLMTVFFEGTKESKTVIGARYTSIRVAYSDDSARKVERNLVPAERIVPDISIKDQAVVDGRVDYVIKEAINSKNGINVDTVVKKWPGANSYRAVGFPNIKYPNTDGLNEEQMAENLELMSKTNAGPAKDLLVRMSNVKGSSDYKYSFPVIYWYKGEFDEENWEPTGELLAVECANFYLKLGDPMPWPNYLNPEVYDLTKLNESDLSFRIEKADGTKAAFADVTYDKNKGTATVKNADGNVSAGDDLTKYNLYTEVKAPANAKYYKYSNYFEAMLLGGYYADTGYQAHGRTLSVGEYVVPTNGKAIFDCDLLKEATYANDKGLKVYYDSNPTLNGVGGAVYFIEWYDENYELIDTVWFVTQFSTLADTEEVEIETSIPTSAIAPTLVTADAGNGFKLQVASFPQTSETGTQIHYELTLLKNGLEVPLDELSSDGVTLFIPYPSTIEDVNAVEFTVNHYNGAGKMVDSFIEDTDSSVKLERADTGVYMTVTSLSPFVLSWETPDVDVSALPSTGDNSLPLVALMGMLALAVTGSFMLRRKANA